MRLVVLGTGSVSSTPLAEGAGALGAALEVVTAPEAIGPATGTGRRDCTVFDLDALPGTPDLHLAAVRRLSSTRSVVAIGSGLTRHHVRDLFAAGCRDVIGAPPQKRELILRLSATMHDKLRIACIGGGSGLFTVLSAIKDVPRLLLSSIVTMSDDGGSSGRLRASFGVLPPGDVRRSLVALSNAPEVMNYVMQYRFHDGNELGGHSLGNLLLTALSELTGGMQNAVKALGDVLNVQGIVMCVTERSTTLIAELEDGQIIRGESAIDQCIERSSALRLRRVWHEPAAETSVDVFASILGADLVVIGPGDLYTSVLANLVVGGVAEAVQETRGKRIYVCNMMTKPGETTDYDVADHAAAVVAGLGGDVLDHILVSSTTLDERAVLEYAALAQHPVASSSEERMLEVTRAQVILADVGDRALLVRHDATKLREHLLRLIAQIRPSIAPTSA